MNTKEYPTIPVGTRLEAIRNIYFVDGDFHKKGEVYIVKENTQAYFEVNAHDYKLVN